MPIDFTKPAVTGNYSTGVLQPINDALKALAQFMDPAVAGTLTSTPTGAFRLNNSAGNASFEKWNGSSWVTQTMNYPTLTGSGASGTWGINTTGTWQGYNAASAATVSTVAARDASGHLFCVNVNQSSANSDGSTIGQVMFTTGADGYLRKASLAAMATAIGAQSLSATGNWNFSSLGAVGAASRSGNLTASGLSGAAGVMSFWRDGAYAVNFGLDTDNVVRLGGWSDGASVYRWQSNAAGNFYIRGSLYVSNGGNYLNGVTGTYGSLEMVGLNNAYTGVSFHTSAAGSVTGMFDASGNGGDYDVTTGWHFYWKRSDACLAIGGATTSASYKAYINGALYASGDITAFSDKRAKSEFDRIDSPLDKIARLAGYAFTWATGSSKGKRSVGLLAQDVELVLPEAVHTDENTDAKGVNYNGVLALAIEGVNALRARIEVLEAQPA
jgi:hypothetical protein